MPDEAQTDLSTTEQDLVSDAVRKTRRATAATAAQAHELAAAAQVRADAAASEADNAVSLFESLSIKVTDLATQVADLRDGLAGGLVTNALTPVEEVLAKVDVDVAALNRWRDSADQVAVTRDMVDNRIAEALRDFAPDSDSATHQMDRVLARLEAIERQPSGGGEQWDELARRVEATAAAAVAKVIANHQRAGTLPTGTGRPAPGGVHAKVLEVMRLVDRLAKDREMSDGPRFMYRGIDDAMDAVGRAMRQVGLVYTTRIIDREVSRDEAENKQGRRMLWTSVMMTVEYTFVDPEDGSTQSFQMAGEGRAADDKATSKAAAMALKYGLLHALMIPVSAIPDGDAESPQVDRPERPPANLTDAPRRAAKAVQAVQAVQGLPSRERYARLCAIGKQVHLEGLDIVEVPFKDERVPLGTLLSVQIRMAATESAAQDGPALDPNPTLDA